MENISHGPSHAMHKEREPRGGIHLQASICDLGSQPVKLEFLRKVYC